MAIKDLRAALLAVKKENAEERARILSLLESAIQLAEKKKAEAKRESELLRGLSSDAALTRIVIRKSGEEYLKERLQNEKELSGFLSSLSPIAELLKKSLSGFRVDAKAREDALSALETRYNAWYKNKNSDWTKGLTDMNETRIKSQLLAVIDGALDDFAAFRDKAANLTEERTGTALTLTEKTITEIGKLRESLSATYIADTEENYTLAVGLIDAIAAIRGKITSIAPTIYVNNGLRDAAKYADLLVESPATGKKLSDRKNLTPFVAPSVEAITKGQADEFASAMFVFDKLAVNNEFFENVKTMVGESLSKSKILDYKEDQVYIGLKTQADTLATTVRQLQAAGNNPGALKVAYNNFLSVKEKLDRRVRTINEENARQFEQQMRTLDQLNVSDKFSEIANLFTGTSSIPYALRASIMIASGTCDFAELFTEYLTAATLGDKNKMIEIEGKLAVMKKRFNQSATIEELERNEMKRRELEAASASLSRIPEPETAANDVVIDDSLLMGFGEGEAPKATEDEAPAIMLDGIN